MPEIDAHIPGMNAVSFVGLRASSPACPRLDAISAPTRCSITSAWARRVYRNLETYSTGMKQRIKLAQALVHDPDLLFLDEPTNGMDPKGREEMLELIRDLAHNKGMNLASVLAPAAGCRVHLRSRGGPPPGERGHAGPDSMN